LLKQHWSSQWRKPKRADDEDALTFAIIELAARGPESTDETAETRAFMAQ
jgi:hypothetical protein